MKTYKKQLGKEKEDLADLIHKRYDLDKKVRLFRRFQSLTTLS